MNIFIINNADDNDGNNNIANNDDLNEHFGENCENTMKPMKYDMEGSSEHIEPNSADKLFLKEEISDMEFNETDLSGHEENISVNGQIQKCPKVDISYKGEEKIPSQNDITTKSVHKDKKH